MVVGNAASVESEVSRLREQLQTQQVELKEMSQLREQLQERELEKEQVSVGDTSAGGTYSRTPL